MQQKDAIIERIKKLQRHAESAKKMGSTQEAEIFAKKATEMLMQHNIDQFQVDQHKLDSEDEFKNWGFAEQVSYQDNQSGSRWRIRLVGVLTEHNLCSYVFNSHFKTFEVYGKMENVDATVWMYHFLSIGLLRIAQEHHVALSPELKKVYNRYAYLKDFLLGAVEGIDRQLTRQKEEMQRSNPSMNQLIVYNAKALDTFLYDKVPGIKDPKKSKKVYVGPAYTTGIEVGEKYNIIKTPLNESSTPKTKLLK